MCWPKFLSVSVAAGIALCGAGHSQGGPPGAADTGADFTLASSQQVVHVHVLESRRVNGGDHSITYNKIAPPVLPPNPAPSPIPAPPEVVQAIQERENKQFETLFLSATVYDHQVTELRWIAGGREYRAYSNIDFNYFCGVGQIETADTVYELLISVGNDSREAADAANRAALERGLPSAQQRQIPLSTQFSPTRSEYMLVDDGSESAPDEALAGIDALHVYYDANRQKLADDYAMREAARTAREEWVKAHPQVPQDTVINYWKMEGAPARGN